MKFGYLLPALIVGAFGQNDSAAVSPDAIASPIILGTTPTCSGNRILNKNSCTCMCLPVLCRIGWIWDPITCICRPKFIIDPPILTVNDTAVAN